MITWFIYLLLNGGIFLIIIWFAALKLIPQLARPEAKVSSGGWTLLTLIVVTASLLAMPSVVKWLRTMPAKHKLALYCKGQEVGKHVYERLTNVSGVFSYLPAGDFMNDFMHRDDITVVGRENYTKLPEKRYESFESTSFDPKADRVAPGIRYGFTWTPLTSIQDRNNKLYGDETTIFDNETGKVLATRVVYYILSEKEDRLETACSAARILTSMMELALRPEIPVRRAKHPLRRVPAAERVAVPLRQVPAARTLNRRIPQSRMRPILARPMATP